MKRIAWFVLGGLLSCLVVPVQGQEAAPEPVCGLSDTIDACLRALVDFQNQMPERAVADSSKNAVAEIDPQVAAKLTPFDSAGSVLGTDAKSLLDLFAVAIEDAQVDDDTGAVTLTWNSKLFGQSGTDGAHHNRIQLQTVINKAQLFEPLKQAIPEAERAARVEVLEEDLEDLDDVSFNLTYARENKKFGRSSDSHRSWLQSIMKQQASTVSSQEANEILFDRLQWVQQLLENEEVTPTSTTLQEVCGMIIEDPSLAPAGLPYRQTLTGPTEELIEAALLQWFQVAREAEEKLEAKMQAVLAKETLPKFANLLNNQPELTGSATFRARSELTGPDSYSLNVVFKTGLANVNWLRRELDDGCGTSWSEACQTEYTTLVTDNEDRIARPWNIVFKLEYKHEDDYAFTIPALEEGDDMSMEGMSEPARKMDAIPFSLAETDQLVVSFSASKVLRSNDEGVQTAGLAFNADYNFVDNENDPDIMGRQERLVASVTYTQRINDQFSLPIGLVWANEGEFLPEVDDTFSVNFGLKFRLTKNEKKNDKK